MQIVVKKQSNNSKVKKIDLVLLDLKMKGNVRRGNFKTYQGHQF